MAFLTVEKAAEKIKQGDVVAIPTETVYGLACDATNEEAVKKIFALKGRPSDNPLIVHIAHMEEVYRVCEGITPKALKLMDTFWPGPLSVVLSEPLKIAPSVLAGQQTVAIRMPAHDVAREIITKAGAPIAAPSANLSGKPSSRTAVHVLEDFESEDIGIVEGGVAQFGLESTVIDMSGEMPVILRPGAITQEAIEAVLGETVTVSDEVKGSPKAPGMKYKHYAPKAPLYLMEKAIDLNKNSQENTYKKQVQDVLNPKHLQKRMTQDAPITAWLIHPDNRHLYEAQTHVYVIEPNGANLYDVLRMCDTLNINYIVSEMFEDVALMNRLKKAATAIT